MNSKEPIFSPPGSASDSRAAPRRCGYVALVGRPNAGKSTLFNTFLAQRLSIVTPRAQTTRRRILGILTRPQSQMIFLDTPGLLSPRYRLHERMGRQIEQALREADVVLLLLDPTRPRDRDELVREFLARNRAPLLVLLNKIDLLEGAQVERCSAALRRTFDLEHILPISALRGHNTELLLRQLEEHLPPGPQLYPEEMIAEEPERFFVAELIREALFNQLEDELPYALNVAVEEFAERGKKTYIRALVHVERESQKGIVIGRKGTRLHRVGRSARLEIERFLAAPVYLELWVKVRPDWRDRDRDLKEFGYS